MRDIDESNDPSSDKASDGAVTEAGRDDSTDTVRVPASPDGVDGADGMIMDDAAKDSSLVSSFTSTTTMLKRPCQ